MLNCNTRYYTNLLCYIFLSYYLCVCVFPHAWKYFNLVYFYILLFSLKKIYNHVTPQPHTIHHRIDLIEDSTDKKDRRECVCIFFVSETERLENIWDDLLLCSRWDLISALVLEWWCSGKCIVCALC